MNTNTNDEENQDNYAAFIAIDWADQQHAFSLQVAGQAGRETGTLEQKPEVIGPWVAKLRERFGGRPVAVAVEQSRGALIHALLWGGSSTGKFVFYFSSFIFPFLLVANYVAFWLASSGSARVG